MEHYDVVIIGGGPGGYKAALKLIKLKKKVLIIEKRESHIGGTCLNEGCIPVKALLETAELFSEIKMSDQYGITANVKPVDMIEVKKTIQKDINFLRKGLYSVLKSKKISFIFGKGSFLTRNKIQIEQEGEIKEITGDIFIIATGSKAKEIPGLAIDEKIIFSSSEIMESDTLPENLLIIGGGYIGCEFAAIYNKLGVLVTLIDQKKRLLSLEEEDISRTLMREFKKNGIKVMTGVSLKEVRVKNSQAEIILESLDKKGELGTQSFDRILVAAGREPNIEDLNLNKIGLKIKNGFIEVDQAMRTSIQYIYAIGDVIDTPMLAYTAYQEALIAVESINSAKKTKFNTSVIPRIIFSEPQIGAAGFTETQLKEKGVNFSVYKSFFKSNGKAVIMKKDSGFIKIMVDKETGKILGTSIIGPYATELIHELTLAIHAGIKITEIAKTPHGHPTLSELIWDTAMMYQDSHS